MVRGSEERSYKRKLGTDARSDYKYFKTIISVKFYRDELIISVFYWKEGEIMADRTNKKLNEEIEKYISRWHGTPTEIMVSKMYYGGIADYEDICEIMGIDYGDWEE